MKLFTSTLAIALTLVAGQVFAAANDTKAPEPATPPAKDQMDHSKMNMDKSGDHATADASEFALLDRNKDGSLSKVEVASNSKLVKHFDMLDANKDGSLTPAECAKQHDM